MLKTMATMLRYSAVLRLAPAVRPPQLALPPRSRVATAATPAGGKPIEKLKRAPSPFNLFHSAKYAEAKADLLAKGKDGTLTECTTHLREQWNKLTDTQKQPFQAKAVEIKAAIKQAKAEGRIPVKKIKKVQDPAGPKPITVYAAFTKAEFPMIKAKNPKLTTPEIAKLIGALWKNVDSAKKDALKAQYVQEMAAYQERQSKLTAAPPAAPPDAPPPAKAAPATPRAATPAAIAASTKLPSPTPGQQVAPQAKATTSPVRSATPAKRATPAK